MTSTIGPTMWMPPRSVPILYLTEGIVQPAERFVTLVVDKRF